MTQPSLRRPLATWSFLVGLVRAMTQPPADIARCDERVETLAADCRIGRALSAFADACRRACTSSAVVAACRRTVWPLVPEPLSERVRAAGCVAAVAAVTTLVLRPAGNERDPLTWIVPSVVAAIAVVCVVASASIARSIDSYHS
jgi:hypothetical protein